jgi:hypothetical protein
VVKKAIGWKNAKDINNGRKITLKKTVERIAKLSSARDQV